MTISQITIVRKRGSIIKNGYEILSPFFMKVAGFCVSIYLCILSIKLFVLNPGYAYWQTNAFLVWPIILSAFILCVCFFMFIFMKANNSGIYLFDMYVLCCVKCILFLLVFYTSTRSLPDTNMMLKIILCFGFLFIFLEFLHAQTSRNFIGEKTVLAGIMGITFCIIPLMLTVVFFFFFAFYLLYAISIFILFLQGKETKSSILFQCSLIVFLLLLSSLMIPSVGSSSNSRILAYIMFLEIFAVLGCNQLIHLKDKQALGNVAISPLQKFISRSLPKFYCVEDKAVYRNNLPSEAFPMIKGGFMLTIRFTYFTLLAMSIATIWRR